MNVIDDYKSMINDVSRPLFVFASSLDYKTSASISALKTWTADIISDYSTKLLGYNPARRIKDYILAGDPDDATIIRRIQIVDYELSQEPLWQPQYRWMWNAKLFDPMCVDIANNSNEKDKTFNEQISKENKSIYEKLKEVNGEIWALSILTQLGKLAEILNYKVKEVEDQLNSLYKFACKVNDKEHEHWHLPKVLNTSLARTIFQKCFDKGWLTKSKDGLCWKGISSKGRIAQLAYLCGRIYGYEHSVYGNRGVEFPEAELCEVFKEKQLYKQLVQAHSVKNPQKWRKVIDELFD